MAPLYSIPQEQEAKEILLLGWKGQAVSCCTNEGCNLFENNGGKFAEITAN
jgi:hypothetical protein